MARLHKAELRVVEEEFLREFQLWVRAVIASKGKQDEEDEEEEEEI